MEYNLGKILYKGHSVCHLFIQKRMLSPELRCLLKLRSIKSLSFNTAVQKENK
jgi:hypothetical protein